MRWGKANASAPKVERGFHSACYWRIGPYDQEGPINVLQAHEAGWIPVPPETIIHLAVAAEVREVVAVVVDEGANPGRENRRFGALRPAAPRL